jgi:predicted transcriptional regulator
LAKNNETPPADESKKLPIEDQLKGKTLKVYMYMVKKKEPVGIREVQRDLGFSSPSVANYHIDKLVGLALVDQDEFGRYFMVQRVRVGVLQHLSTSAG